MTLAPPPLAAELPTSSEADRELARLRIVVGNLEAIRTEKVQDLTAQIAGGRYHVGAHDVAHAVLRELLGQLLG